MFPNCPCHRPGRRRAPFAAPADARCSILRSCQPENASGDIAMPIERVSFVCFSSAYFPKQTVNANTTRHTHVSTHGRLSQVVFSFRIIFGTRMKRKYENGKEFMALNGSSLQKEL